MLTQLDTEIFSAFTTSGKKVMGVTEIARSSTVSVSTVQRYLESSQNNYFEKVGSRWQIKEFKAEELWPLTKELAAIIDDLEDIENIKTIIDMGDANLIIKGIRSYHEYIRILQNRVAYLRKLLAQLTGDL